MIQSYIDQTGAYSLGLKSLTGIRPVGAFVVIARRTGAPQIRELTDLELRGAEGSGSLRGYFQSCRVIRPLGVSREPPPAGIVPLKDFTVNLLRACSGSQFSVVRKPGIEVSGWVVWSLSHWRWSDVPSTLVHRRADSPSELLSVVYPQSASR